MKYHFILVVSLFCFCSKEAVAQFRKIDSTLKIGKVGYQVSCNNKSSNENLLTVRPVGFEGGDARPFSFNIKGKVTKTEIDDLNSDGYPDLVVYVFSGQHFEFGNVIAFASQENKTILPFALPDAMLDGKIKDGYKGHDQFTLLEGRLMREFPIYLPTDSANKPTGGKRFVQYSVISSNGGYQFKVVATHDVKE